MSDTFIDNGFGGKDEQAMQEHFEYLVGGVAKAERLMWLWNNSYPNGSKYDQTFKTGHYHSKENVFEYKAKAEGFTQEQINCFHAL